MFVCFEGIDGVGKSTQAAMLVERLRANGHTVELVADPGTTEIGKAVRHILLENNGAISSEAQFLLFAAARAELAHHIRQLLEAGTIVVCDRWLLSSLVYQGVLNHIRDELILKVFAETTGNLLPDVCFLLTAPVEVAVARMKGPTDRYESIDMEQRKRLSLAYDVYAVFSDHARETKFVSADRPPQETADAVYEVVSQQLSPARSTP